MTKSERKELDRAIVMVKLGHEGMAARMLGNLHRATLTAKAKAEIFTTAQQHNLTNYPEFII